jgi:hypothetical protein
LRKLQRTGKDDTPHPYRDFEGTPLWKAIDKGIGDLIKNQDLKEMTPRAYVVGYLCKILTRHRVALPPD